MSENWSEKSWLKYFIAYLVDENKYFLYPRISLSTNFSDAGTHMGSDTTIYQTPLFYGTKNKFEFSDIRESLSVYDSFFENRLVNLFFGFDKNQLCVDLYGYRQHTDCDYWLTSKKMNYKIVRTFGRSLKPIEANIYQNIEGKDLFLYDTRVSEKNSNSFNSIRKINYSVKFISFKNTFILLKSLFFNRIRGVILRIFKYSDMAFKSIKKLVFYYLDCCCFI